MKGQFRLLVLIPIFSLLACNSKKKVILSGDEPVDIKDFIESFQPLDLPYQIADTSVSKKRADTTLISYKVFTHLVPDTLLSKVFGKEERPKIYPMGRVAAPEQGTYLFVKALSADRKAALILCFDKKNNFITAMPVMQPDANPATQQVFVLDKRFTLSKGITRRNADGTISDGKNVYVLNEPAKSFLLIMTDALDEKTMEIINPIDSLSRKNKFSADYQKDKLNFISIRDSRKAGRLVFFVHFEKKNNCSGEIKGEANFTSANSALFRGSGDPCTLQFTFTSSSVSMKEVQGCGSHRGVDCIFDGTYPRKKEVKKKEQKSKKTSK
ncbi:MAG TPA: hypothetical protein VGQ53_13960 [Chitinophagaceae bacterium]|jgi:hypothetical protein|nr:hypothetical protein [Chitinophagaceae bacterium]